MKGSGEVEGSTTMTDSSSPTADGEEEIPLECLRCGKRVPSPRMSWDPPGAVLAKSTCPRCLDKGHGREPEFFYYDRDGKELSADPEGHR